MSFHRLGVCLLVLGLALHPAPVFAATLVVDTMVDADAIDGKCSLREAITAANNNADYSDCKSSEYGNDTIYFVSDGTITLGSQLPNVTDAAGLTIYGAGFEVEISGNDQYQVFWVANGAALTLSDLTVSHGTATNGGGANNLGTLTVISSTFAHNSADSGGGALFNEGGTTSVTGTTFLSNTAGQFGGAVRNDSGDAHLTNSTLMSNTAGKYGGAVFNGEGCGLYLTNCTLVANSAQTGTVTNWSGLTYLKNTIVSDSTGGNCAFSIANSGNNLEDTATCGWGTANGSMSWTDPGYGSLGTHGGSGPQTMSLKWDSPAVDGVTYNAPNGCPEKDQRAVDRPVDGNGDGTAVCDIGAYEALPAVFLPASIRDQ